MAKDKSKADQVRAEAEALKLKTDRAIKNGYDELGQQLAITEKDGKASILGIPVNKAMVPFFNLAYASVILPITNAGARKIYEGALHIAERSGASNAHQIADAVELTSKMGILLAKPVSELYDTHKKALKRRRELHNELQEAVEGTPVNYAKNEIVQSAYTRLNAKWSHDLKQMLPDLPTYGLQAVMAYQSHQEIRKKRFPGGVLPSSTASGVDPIVAKADEFGSRWNKAKQTLMGNDASQETIEHAKSALEREIFGTGGVLNAATDAKSFLENKDMILPGLAQAGGDALAKAINEENKVYAGNKVIAWDMIKSLHAEVSGSATRDAADVRVDLNGKSVSLKEYIIEVFQQNEMDHGRARLGETLVAQLEPSVEKIAGHIADTTLSANALVHLVGEDQIIIHKGTARAFAKEEDVSAAIHPMMGVNTATDVESVDDFFANFADPKLAEEVLKKDIKELDGNEKALFVSLFPDEILERAGMKRKDIVDARKQAHVHVYDAVMAEVLELAHKDKDELTRMGLGKKDIKAIEALSREVEHGNMDAVRVAVDGSDRTVVGAVRNAGMSEEMADGGNGKKVWSKIVEKGETVQEKLKSGKLGSQEATSFAEKARAEEDPEVNQDELVEPAKSATAREAVRRDKAENDVQGHLAP